MKCYHGTTKNGLRAILANYNHKPTNPWSVSDQDGAMYVWPLNKIDGYNGDEIDTTEDRGLSQAFESSQIQAVHSEDYNLYVLELEIDDESLEDDYSCENMADLASFIPISEFNKDMIKKVYHYKMNKWHAPFVISGLLDNSNFNTYSIDESLLEVSQTLRDQSIYNEDIYIFEEYTEVNIENLAVEGVL